MTESELYKELGILTKHRELWEENIPYVLPLLHSESVRIRAKALWLLGEMGLAFPSALKDGVSEVAPFLSCAEPLHLKYLLCTVFLQNTSSGALFFCFHAETNFMEK